MQNGSFPSHCFARGRQIPVPLVSAQPVSVVPEGVAQEVQALARYLQVHYPRLLAVELQPEPPLQFAFDKALQWRTDVSRQHHKIIGIPYQFGFGPSCRAIRPVKHPVKPVQVDVGQQRTQDSALRRGVSVAPDSRWLALSLGGSTT